MWKLVLPMALLLACKKEQPQPVPTPSPVVASGELDPKLAAEIVTTAAQLMDAPPAPISDETKKAAVDPSALVGNWSIKHTISIMDGKPGSPTPPIMPMTWTLGKDGSFAAHGANELSGTFVLTKDHLVVSAVGVPLEYTVDKLTPTELVITQMIMPTMGSTVVLERAP